MIERYTREQMGKIWSDQNKYQNWLKVEIAVLKAREKQRLVTWGIVGHIEENADFTVERIEEIDREIEHDMLAFIRTVQEHLDPQYAGEFHKGLTSYDVEDTAFSLMIKQSIQIILEDIEELRYILRERAAEHKLTAMIGRTHGQHAQPTTFGLLLLTYYEALGRAKDFFEQAEEAINYGKISGAVGCYGTSSPKVEEMACQELGLEPARISTQILQRDRIAKVIAAISICGCTLAKIAKDIRLLSQPEIREVREPFKEKQEGSSAMPHKKNPIISERICGQAKVLRANLQVALENIPTWLHRDLTQSSAERVILPDSFALLDYMLDKTRWLIQNLEVYPQNMEKNLKATQQVYASQKVKELLVVRGEDPQKAYRITQEASFKAIENQTPLRRILLTHEPTKSLFSKGKDRQALEDCFDLQYWIKADQIFKRFGIGQEESSDFTSGPGFFRRESK